MTITGADYSSLGQSGFPFSDAGSVATFPGLCDMIQDICVFGARYLTNVTREASSLSFSFEDASVTFAFSSEDLTYRIAYADGRPGGTVRLHPGWADIADGWPIGSVELQAELVPSAYIPLPAVGLRHIVADGVSFSGDVYLVAECGVMFNWRDGKLFVDFIGDSRSRERSCSSSGVYATPTVVKTINNIPPGTDGSFVFIHSLLQSVDPALRIYPDGSNVRLEKL